MQALITPPEASSSQAPDGRAWNQILSPYKGADTRRSVIQVLNSAIPFFLTWWLMLRSLEVSYALTLLLAVPAMGFMTRLFIIQHDCGHGSFFRSSQMSQVVGFLIGIITLTPYGYWRRTHAIHHATAGDLDGREFGDVATITVREYLSRGTWGRFRYRVYRNPFVLFGVGAAFQFVVKHRLPWDTPFAWKKEWASVLWTNLAIAGVITLMVQTIGWRSFLLVQAPITLLAASWGVWLFYMQHQFEDTYWQPNDSWDYHDAALHGSSHYALPKVLQWFTGNIGLHHVHHLSSRIPNYKLQQCHDENPELQKATSLTLKESLSCIKLKLWDEASGKLISWKELRQIRKKLVAV